MIRQKIPGLDLPEKRNQFRRQPNIIQLARSFGGHSHSDGTLMMDSSPRLNLNPSIGPPNLEMTGIFFSKVHIPKNHTWTIAGQHYFLCDGVKHGTGVAVGQWPGRALCPAVGIGA